MIAGHEARSEGHDASIAVGKFPNLETHAYARVTGSWLYCGRKIFTAGCE
jgi:hypothetical protein